MVVFRARSSFYGRIYRTRSRLYKENFANVGGVTFSEGLLVIV